ncbi:MAG: hypothetical protein ACKVOE_10615 [Rickettsiales bacterium]
MAKLNMAIIKEHAVGGSYAEHASTLVGMLHGLKISVDGEEALFLDHLDQVRTPDQLLALFTSTMTAAHVHANEMVRSGSAADAERLRSVASGYLGNLLDVTNRAAWTGQPLVMPEIGQMRG